MANEHNIPDSTVDDPFTIFNFVWCFKCTAFLFAERNDSKEKCATLARTSANVYCSRAFYDGVPFESSDYGGREQVTQIHTYAPVAGRRLCPT